MSNYFYYSPFSLLSYNFPDIIDTTPGKWVFAHLQLLLPCPLTEGQRLTRLTFILSPPVPRWQIRYQAHAHVQTPITSKHNWNWDKRKDKRWLRNRKRDNSQRQMTPMIWSGLWGMLNISVPVDSSLESSLIEITATGITQKLLLCHLFCSNVRLQIWYVYTS